MIKAGLTADDGSKIVLLGLSAKNVEKLKAGDPMKVEGKHVGVPGVDVYIMYGETESAIMADLRRMGFQMPDKLIVGRGPG